MKLYFRSSRWGQTCRHTSYEGVSEALARQLMEEIGHTDIEEITEEEYLAATQQ